MALALLDEKGPDGVRARPAVLLVLVHSGRAQLQYSGGRGNKKTLQIQGAFCPTSRTWNQDTSLRHCMYCVLRFLTIKVCACKPPLRPAPMSMTETIMKNLIILSSLG